MTRRKVDSTTQVEIRYFPEFGMEKYNYGKLFG